MTYFIHATCNMCYKTFYTNHGNKFLAFLSPAFSNFSILDEGAFQPKDKIPRTPLAKGNFFLVFHEVFFYLQDFISCHYGKI